MKINLTFNIPNGSNRSLWGNTRSKDITSGLPNIDGGINFRMINNNQHILTSVTGVFTIEDTTITETTVSQNSTQRSYQHLYFSAKNSNSIYGTTSYVRPQSIGVKFAIMY